MKKITVFFLPLLCVVLALLSSTTFSSARDFTDVEEDKWYSESIGYVSNKGIMRGTSENRFSPDIAVTRAQMVQLLYNMADSPAVDGETVFSDVHPLKWYTKAVDWASEIGLVDGYGDGTFHPDDSITREQMAKILLLYTRKMEIPGVGLLDDYDDGDKVSEWAKEGIIWALSKDLIRGTSSTMLSPRGTATRGQIATIIERYCKNVATEYEWPREFKNVLPEADIAHKPNTSGYKNEWDWVGEPDLFMWSRTDDGCLAFKYLGAIEEAAISLDGSDCLDSITLTVYMGDEYVYGDNATNYRCYPGEEIKIGFPYGPGEYHLMVRFINPKREWQYIFNETINVSSEEYESSLLASNTMSNYKQTNMIQIKADEICKELTDDRDKAFALFKWMSRNLFYDKTRLDEISWGYTPAYNRIVEKNGAICLDFAGFYAALCRSQGIKTRIDVGWVYKGIQMLEGYHAWNEIYFDGEWHQIDPTRVISSTDYYYTDEHLQSIFGVIDRLDHDYYEYEYKY